MPIANDKQRKYNNLTHMWSAGKINAVNELTNYITVSRLAKDINKSPVALKKLLGRVGKFRIEEIYGLSQLLKDEKGDLLRMIWNQYKLEVSKKTTKQKRYSKQSKKK